MTKKTKSAVENQPIYQHAKGIVKGKGSYQRKAKYASNWFEKPDDKVFDFRNFIIGFFVSISV